jgi:EmrB/QacA subfamily drug resistance transporter
MMVDITIVNTALPAIQSGLHMSTGGLEWVVSAYALSLAAFIPVSGALGDRFGRKHVFLLGLGGFVVGSVGCALSTTDQALIAARAVQGVGGAVVAALSLAILTDAYQHEDRASAIGIWAAIGGLGFGIGPVAGGLLLSVFDWPSVFWVNVPFGLIALALTSTAVRSGRAVDVRSLDVPGVFLSALGLLGLTLGLIESSTTTWTSTRVSGPFIAGILLLVAFLLWEERAASPMLPPRLLRTSSFATRCLVFLLVYVAWEGVMFYVTLLYQDVEGWSALQTGVSWLAMNLPFLVMAQCAGWLSRRYPSFAIVAVGCLLAGAAIAGLSSVTSTSPFFWTCACYIGAGAGYGMLAPAVATMAMRRVPSDVAGVASGLLSTARQVGTSVGLAVPGALGAAAATSSWVDNVRALPVPLRSTALAESQHVGTARIASVTLALGDAYRAVAVQSFTHGYQLAMLVAAGCVLAAGAASALGLLCSR